MIGGTEQLQQVDGCFYGNGIGGKYGHGHDNSATNPRITINASRSSSIYGASNTIRPISKEVIFMIRY